MKKRERALATVLLLICLSIIPTAWAANVSSFLDSESGLTAGIFLVFAPFVSFLALVLQLRRLVNLLRPSSDIRNDLRLWVWLAGPFGAAYGVFRLTRPVVSGKKANRVNSLEEAGGSEDVQRKCVAILLLAGLALGCIGPADGSLVLMGNVVSSDGKPVDKCKLILFSESRGRGHRTRWRRVEARFTEDFVVGPGESEYYVELSCPESPTVYRSRTFRSTGRSGAEPIQLGEMRLPAADLRKK